VPKRSNAEFVAVIAVSFGYSIVTSFVSALRGIRTHTVTDGSVARLLVFELLGLAICAEILRRRGWELRSFTLQPSWRGTAGGLLLWGASYAIWLACFAVVVVFVSDRTPLTSMRLVNHVSLLSAIALSLVNPIFEESLVTRYIIEWAGTESPSFAISLSSAIRLMYHVYQGPAATVTILPLGVLYAAVYWRWRKIWPLLIAHGLLDFTALRIGTA